MSRTRVTRAEFIRRANEIHDEKYLYAHMGELKGSHSKVTIICYKHGEFVQHASGHLQGRGCPKCGWYTALIKFKENTVLREEYECYEFGRTQITEWLNRSHGEDKWDQH